MGARYVPIVEAEFAALMAEMGFGEIKIPGTYERVYQRQVATKGGKLFPYAVRVYSSIVGNDSRGVGEDAIRLVLIDMETDRPLKKAESRVYRTKSALENTRERARELFAMVIKNICPDCGEKHGGFMRRRTGRNGDFMGCSRYPHCRRTHPVVVDEPTAAMAKMKDLRGEMQALRHESMQR